MTVTDFLQLPPAVRILVGVMLWPAIWAGTLLIVALTGDLIRRRQEQNTSRAARSVLLRYHDAARLCRHVWNQRQLHAARFEITSTHL